MLRLIPIESISPNSEPRLRRLNDGKVQALVQSIQEIGLQSPISLRARPTMEAMPGCHEGNAYHVVAGEHRLQACKVLGWREIPSFIVDLDDARCQLWEIDENLVRAELTELERAEHIRVRKIVYERIHPETRHGGDRKSEQYRENQVANSATCSNAPSFVDDTAQKAGMSERAIRQCIERAEAIAPEVKDAIADMPEIANRGVELDALAAVEPEAQKAAVEAVKSGKARNVREATKGAKKRKGSRKAKPAPSDEEIVRRAVLAAVKQCQNKTAHRLAAIQISFNGSAINVAVSFRQ